MRLTEIQRSTNAVPIARRIAKILIVRAERDELVRKIIRAIDFLVGLSGAAIAFTPSIRALLSPSLVEIAIAVPPIALVLSSLYFIFSEASHPDRKKDHAVDLLFHVDQVESALAAVTSFSSSDRLRLGTESLEEGIRQATRNWPTLLAEFL